MVEMARSDAWNRTSEDPWDKAADAEWRGATRRRVVLARTLGLVGVLGTLALAVAAFLPRMPTAEGKLDGFANRVTLPWDPKLAAGPEAIELDEAQDGVRLSVAFSAAPATAAPATTSPPEPLPEVPQAAETQAAPAIDSSPPVREQSPPVPERSVAPQRARPEPTMTPVDIQLRKQRYERWLREQGLERIH